MDLALKYENEIFDLSFSDGEIVSSDGVVESALTTIFLNENWWGNEYLNDKIGSKIMQKLNKAKDGEEDKEDLKKSLESSLDWMKKEKIAEQILVDVDDDGLVSFNIDELNVRVTV